MGASSSGNEVNFKAALLVCFTEIKELVLYFKTLKLKKKTLKPLAEIIYYSIRNNSDLKYEIENFNLMISIVKEKEKKKDIYSTFQFVLKRLHEELNESNEKERKDINEDFDDYQKFSENLKKFHISIIQKLFFAQKKITSRCQNRNYKWIENYNISYMEYFDLSSKHGKITLENLIDEKFSEKAMKIECKLCGKKVEHLTSYTFVDYPDIFIMYFERKNNNDIILDYDTTIKIQNEKYNLICFIINKDENNEEVNNYNVFYKENKSWFIFNTNFKRRNYIENISKLKENPLIIFLQRDKTLFNNYYKHVKLLLKDQFNTKTLIYEHLVPEMKYEEYYLVKEEWFNKIIKINQSQEEFENNNFIIHSIKDLVNIKALNPSTFIEKYREFNKRKNYIKDLPSLDVQKYRKNKQENQFSIPRNFVVIKKNLLDDLFKDFEINTNKLIVYEIVFGEGFAFIKKKKEENEENQKEEIYISTLNEENYSFQVISILEYYSKDQFSKEAKKFICNRGGLEYYFQKRNLVLNKELVKHIRDEEKFAFGEMINLVKMNDYINEFKFNGNNKEIKIKKLEDLKTVESYPIINNSCEKNENNNNNFNNNQNNQMKNNNPMINNFISHNNLNIENMNKLNKIGNNNINNNMNNNMNFSMDNMNFNLNCNNMNNKVNNNNNMNNMNFNMNTNNINNNINNNMNNFNMNNNNMNNNINNNNMNNTMNNNSMNNNMNNNNMNKNTNNNINNNMNNNMNNMNFNMNNNNMSTNNMNNNKNNNMNNNMSNNMNNMNFNMNNNNMNNNINNMNFNMNNNSVNYNMNNQMGNMNFNMNNNNINNNMNNIIGNMNNNNMNNNLDNKIDNMNYNMNNNNI